MSKIESILTIIMCTAMLGGCSTMMSGATQEVSFQTSPEDVVVTVTARVRGDGPEYAWHDTSRILGKTPLTLQLDKADGQSVVFSKDGYKPVTMKLTTTLDSWFWGNIVFGGVIGSLTDSMSGAVNEYSPSQFFVTLTPDGVSRIENSTLKSQRDKAKEFIVGRYTNLMTNVSQGGGEDFNALMVLLKIEKTQQADALRKIRALFEVYTDAPAFADHVIALYLK